MNDRIISAIGHWQLNQKRFAHPADMYIENIFPGKDYQMLLLLFSIVKSGSTLTCTYDGIDVEKVKKDSLNYRKYAYRKGSPRGGDITITTKLSNPPDRKLKNIKEIQFKKLTSSKHPESELFKLIEQTFRQNEKTIQTKVEEYFKDASKEEQVTTGISFRIHKKEDNCSENILYLSDFEIVQEIIEDIGVQKKYDHNGTESRTDSAICSVTGKTGKEIYGFAAPFKYSTPDKPGFISGFFNKKKFWRNYPVSREEAMALEYGGKYIKQHLTGYFYGHEFLFVPHPILSNNEQALSRTVNLLQDAFASARDKKRSKEERAGSEEYVQRMVGKQDDFFYLDVLFYSENKTTQAITIEMMLEEILPSRFKQLFIDVPEQVNRNLLYQNAIRIKKENRDLKFSFRIVSDFFENQFLDVVQNIFSGQPISKDLLFERIISSIRKNYNKSQTSDNITKPQLWIVLEAMMLIDYLQRLNIIKTNKNYHFMETVENEKKDGRFNSESFIRFVKDNPSFLDRDVKVGIFAVGVLVRFLFNIQYGNLKSTPFENKLRGFNLNSDQLKQVYVEALDKIQKYQKNFYVYSDLREIIDQYFTLHSHEMESMSNNEISFYFVAGLEMGHKFRNENKEEESEEMDAEEQKESLTF